MIDQTSKVGCACVIANGQWEPCREHDAELASLEATGGVQMERVPLADAGFSLIRMSGAHTRETGAWHTTDSHMTVTPRNKAPDRSGRAVTLGAAFIGDWRWKRDAIDGWPVAPECPALYALLWDEARADARAEYEAQRAEVMSLSQARNTTRKAREERKAKREATGMRARPTRHNEEHVERPVMDAERMARLANALTVGGDSWIDRRG